MKRLPPFSRLPLVLCAFILAGCFDELTGPEDAGWLIITPDAETLNAIGDSVRLRVERLDANHQPVGGGTFLWESLNEEVMTIVGNGIALARSVGVALVTVSCTATCGDRPDTVALTVRQVVASVSLRPEAATLALGYSGQMAVTAADSNGVRVQGVSFEWGSSDPSVAAVSSGRVEGLSAGTTTISAATEGVSGTAWVTVVHTRPAIASVSLYPSDTTLIVGDTARIQAIASDSFGVPVLGVEYTWVSSDPTVATIDNGLVEAESLGATTVTATAEGIAGSASVHVVPPPPLSIPAFPGAEGFGAIALDGCNRRTPRVLSVSNLNDAGPGSFRQAMADAESGPDSALKVITFRVAGYIQTYSRIDFSGNCLYIAGQTAPGDGVTIRGRGLEFHSDPRDIVIRFLRIRLGNTGSTDNGILVRHGANYIFDHLSLSWSPRTLLRFSRTLPTSSGPIKNVTVQRSLLGESLSAHPTALQIGGEPDTVEQGTVEGWRENTQHSIHHNALVSNSHRNPNARGVYVEVINNVIHNWNLDGGQTGLEAVVDFVNNYVQKGPMSRESYVPIGVGARYVLSPPHYEPSIYAVGNLSLGGDEHSDQNTNPNADNWQGGTRVVGWYLNDPSDQPIPQYRRNQRLTMLVDPPVFPIAVQDPYDARESVLEDVGANMGLDCRGQWIPRMDAVDQRLIQDVRDRGGWRDRPGPHHESDVGGFPSLDPGTPCTDSDSDGIPDEWEAANGLNPGDPADAGLIGADGYSYLEHFLNGTTP